MDHLRICIRCGHHFTAASGAARYCAAACRQAAYRRRVEHDVAATRRLALAYGVPAEDLPPLPGASRQ